MIRFLTLLLFICSATLARARCNGTDLRRHLYFFLTSSVAAYPMLRNPARELSPNTASKDCHWTRPGTRIHICRQNSI